MQEGGCIVAAYVVENENALEDDDISTVHRGGLLEPGHGVRRTRCH
jgi:hypothetical protein